ncbi:hypothetical protein BTN50_0597 [Candidatus Enterovibrio altilux]|uniref:Uncharacterized protein n=1 Tax=Candidatus Enterovibrio altilux TaxID=1927128 RepID=A0A291B806_9GAMM|nr:hypothetical protein BTN50_0597 [Candidatus Enterovibrio luxaltus]
MLTNVNLNRITAGNGPLNYADDPFLKIIFWGGMSGTFV